MKYFLCSSLPGKVSLGSFELGLCSSALASLSFLPCFIFAWSITEIQESAHVWYLQCHVDDIVTTRISTTLVNVLDIPVFQCFLLLASFPTAHIVEGLLAANGATSVPGNTELGHCISNSLCHFLITSSPFSWPFPKKSPPWRNQPLSFSFLVLPSSFFLHPHFGLDPDRSFTGKVCQPLLSNFILNVIHKSKRIWNSYEVHFQSPNNSHSDFLVSWGNTNLGSFLINIVRNEYVDFWHSINQRRQT